MDDRAVRERLSTLAGEVPPQTVVPEGLVRRARRRGALVLGSAVVAAAVVAISLAGGVRALLRAEPKPAVPPVPAPVEMDDAITVMIGRQGGDLPTGAASIDPDGEPAARTVLRIGRVGVPLDRSPDGRRLLFATPSGELLVLEDDGTTRHLADTGGLWGASWSPDGSQVVFGSAERGGTSLHVVDADGSDERVLLAHVDDRLLYPSWSPNGSQIAFIRTPVWVEPNAEGCDDDCQRTMDLGSTLWAVGADGSDPRQILSPPRANARAYSFNAPAWSPDGVHLALAAYVGEGQSDVQILIVDLYAVTQLHARPTQLTVEDGDALAPAWSPDGSRIAFVRGTGTRYELTLIDADGSNEGSLPFLVPPLYGATPVLWDRLPV